MNDLPRQRLCEIIQKYGRSLCDDQRRCEGLLRDLCGEYRREVNIIVSALKEQVVSDLLTPQSNIPYDALLSRLTKRLHNDLALTEDAARWAVESWALALGVFAPEPGMEHEERQTLEQVRQKPEILDEFIEQQQGQWNHDEWLILLEKLQKVGFKPIDEAQVGLLLEERRTVWKNRQLELNKQVYTDKHLLTPENPQNTESPTANHIGAETPRSTQPVMTTRSVSTQPTITRPIKADYYRRLQDAQWKAEKPMVWPIVLLIIFLIVFFAIGVGFWLNGGGKGSLGKDIVIADAVGFVLWLIIFRIKRGVEKEEFYKKFR